MDRKKILVYGYGNPGRGDDGLGPALAGRIESEGREGVDTECSYQLNIEDSIAVSGYDAVIFADAATGSDASFKCSRLEPSLEISFTTHAMNPGSVLALCEDLFGIHVQAYMVAISGYIWNFGEGISARAVENLEAALCCVHRMIDQLQKGEEPADVDACCPVQASGVR